MREIPVFDWNREDVLGLRVGLRWLRIHWRALVGAPVLAALLMTVTVLLVPSRYMSSTIILPQNKNSISRLPAGMSGFAAQFGLSLPSDAGQSPQFYVEAATSRGLFVKLLGQNFHDEHGAVHPLIDLLGAGGSTPDKRLDKAIRKLEKRITATASTKSGTVHINVETPRATLSKEVLDTLLANLNAMNLHTLRSQASEKREYLEKRRDDARQDLQRATNALEGFLEVNRQTSNSAALRLREEQLQHDRTSALDLYSTLQREFEMARLQEFDEVPVFSIVDQPYVPVRRSFPNRAVWVVAAALVGFVGVVVWLMLAPQLQEAMSSGVRAPSLSARA